MAESRKVTSESEINALAVETASMTVNGTSVEKVSMIGLVEDPT